MCRNIRQLEQNNAQILAGRDPDGQAILKVRELLRDVERVWADSIQYGS